MGILKLYWGEGGAKANRNMKLISLLVIILVPHENDIPTLNQVRESTSSMSYDLCSCKQPHAGPVCFRHPDII